MRRKDVVFGVLLVAFGLTVLADNLNLVPNLNIWHLWPLVLVALGSARIVWPDGGARIDGLPLVLVGGIFLAHNYHVIHLKDSWPLFIVAAGVSILAAAITRDGRRRQGEGGQPS